jgi:transposase
MGRKPIQLARPDLAEDIERRLRQSKEAWQRLRLQVVRLAAKGELTQGQIAEQCGCGERSVVRWVSAAREGGLEALLARESTAPKSGETSAPMQQLSQAAREALEQGLQKGQWTSATQALRWLLKEHRIKVRYGTMWSWLKKLGGVLRVPRPQHPQNDPRVMEEFKAKLDESFAALGLAAGTKVKIWIMDEARLGLHTPMRRVWIKRGSRPLKIKQTKYEWDYLYGSLEILGGEAHFNHMPSVSLDWDREYLLNLVRTDPEATHILIRDQAGFHLRDGDTRLPSQVRIINLPPYSPQLNACEQLWDVLKDDIANVVFESIEALREGLRPALERFWLDASAVLSLIGRPWLRASANASPKI